MTIRIKKLHVAIAVLIVALIAPTTAVALHVFSDVPDDKFYAEPVAWAKANAITTGKSPTIFDPDGNVTRGESVTFLKRYDDNIVQPALAASLASTGGVATNATGIATNATDVAALQSQVAPLVNSVAAFAGGDSTFPIANPGSGVVQSVSLMPPADGTVIVTSFADVLGPVVFPSTARCSITTGTSLDFGHLQIASVDLVIVPFQAMSGTRGFAVTEGVLFSVNLFCDAGILGGSSVLILDAALTALFAPT